MHESAAATVRPLVGTTCPRATVDCLKTVGGISKMIHRSVLGAMATVFVLSGGLSAEAHTRTPWRMHEGLEVTASNPQGLMPLGCTIARNGDICEYGVATIPGEAAAGWGAAPDGDTIGLWMASRVCQAPATCRIYGDFTYFQTYVTVSPGTVLNEVTLSFTHVDDGIRVTVFNSDHPNGITATGGYLLIGESLVAGNLAASFKPGERNRLVITQVDDCCSLSITTGAVLRINGEVVGLGLRGERRLRRR